MKHFVEIENGLGQPLSLDGKTLGVIIHYKNSLPSKWPEGKEKISWTFSVDKIEFIHALNHLTFGDLGKIQNAINELRRKCQSLPALSMDEWAEELA